MIISMLMYLVILFALSSLLFFSLISIWETNEPVISYLLSVIVVHLLLNTMEYKKTE